MFLVENIEKNDDLDEWSDAESCTSDIDHQEPEEQSTFNEEMYAGASMTIAEFLLCLAALKTHLHLTDVMIGQILKFIAIVLPKPNKCPTSIYKFKQFFSDNERENIIKHFYCLNCNYLEPNSECDINHDVSIEDEETLNDLNSCDCNVNEKSNYFIEVSLISQLKSFFARSGFYNQLKSTITLSDDENLFFDIYSGSIYKSLIHVKNLSSNIRISLMWYTDGIQIFKSSKRSIWVLSLIILELPYEERYKLKNMLLVGLWFGEKKPQPNLFLEPFTKSFKSLYEGIEIYIKDLDKNVILTGLLTAGTCDLPAKSLILSMNQYNGRFGCQVCMHEGETMYHKRVYPYKDCIILRNEHDTLTHAKQAHEIEKPVCGVKGPAMLSKICSLFITSTAVDVMHCVFEGVVVRLGELWFQPKYSREKFSISNSVEIIDSKLGLIKPPVFIARRPRSIKEHFKFWKASELKNWFFYYSIPVLENILPSEYLDHYKYLVLAIYILCQEKITSAQVDLAEKLLREYLLRFQDLYSLKYVTCNMHSLIHLPTTVRRLGPLWTTSCFPLEDLNGKIKNLVHSSKDPHLQIINNLNIYVKLFIINDKWLQQDSDAFNFCNQLENPRKRLKLTKIDKSSSVVGVAKKLKMTEAQNLLLQNNMEGGNVFCFKKLYRNKILYTSKVDQKNKKTESYFIKYREGLNVCVGNIQYFMRVTNCHCNELCDCTGKTYASIEKFDTIVPISMPTEERALFFIHRCATRNSIMKMINIDHLMYVCFHIPIENENFCYIIDPVNLLELE